MSPLKAEYILQNTTSTTGERMNKLSVAFILSQVFVSSIWAANYVPYQPSLVVCRDNPYLSQCSGTREQCEKNPYLAQCSGTQVQCEANPYLAQCSGTPAQCEKNPYLAQCQIPNNPPVDPGVDRLCRENGYTR